MRDAERVVAVVSKIMGVPPEEVTDESSADTIPAWDSLRHMNLILALEEEFEVSFDDEEIVELLTVGLIVDTIRAKRPPA
jgi:acyl carrier protein